MLQFTVKNHGKFTIPVVTKLIRHGRTLRLQSFNNYRKRFNLQAFTSFEELTGKKFIIHIIFDGLRSASRLKSPSFPNSQIYGRLPIFWLGLGLGHTSVTSLDVDLRK